MSQPDYGSEGSRSETQHLYFPDRSNLRDTWGANMHSEEALYHKGVNGNCTDGRAW